MTATTLEGTRGVGDEALDVLMDTDKSDLKGMLPWEHDSTFLDDCSRHIEIDPGFIEWNSLRRVGLRHAEPILDRSKCIEVPARNAIHPKRGQTTAVCRHFRP